MIWYVKKRFDGNKNFYKASTSETLSQCALNEVLYIIYVLFVYMK